jgi:hypothetical protein
LPTSNEALIGVEVDRPQGERRAPARSLGVQAQQQCAESRVVAAGRCNVVDLCEARVGDRGGSRAAGVAWRPFGRIVAGLDVAVVLGVPVQQRRAAIKCSRHRVHRGRFRRVMTLALRCSASWWISDGVGSSNRRVPQCSTIRFQYDPYTRRVPPDTAARTTGMYLPAAGGGLSAATVRCGVRGRWRGSPQPSRPARRIPVLAVDP